MPRAPSPMEVVEPREQQVKRRSNLLETREKKHQLHGSYNGGKKSQCDIDLGKGKLARQQFRMWGERGH